MLYPIIFVAVLLINIGIAAGCKYVDARKAVTHGN